MARPKHKKRICCKKEGLIIRSNSDENAVLTLSLEAFEAFRLIDHEQMTQLQASEQMGVARTTIQALYQEARKAIAKSLVEDKMLKIKGGKHLMHEEKHCRHNKRIIKKVAVIIDEARKVEAYHEAQRFLLLTFEDGNLSRQDLILPEGEEKKLCRRFMLSLGVDTIITSSMTNHTYKKYQECGITVLRGLETFDSTVLSYGSNALESIEDFLTESDHECQHHTHSNADNHGCCHGQK